MVFFLLFLSTFSFSHIIQDDVSTTTKERFSLSTVCKKMVSHESPLIDVVSGTEIDCMGKKVSAINFCVKEMAQDPYYIRAYVDQSSKEVVCHSGKKVLFKYLCVKMSDKKYCDSNPKETCLSLKTKLAYRLDLIHSAVVKNEKGIKQLNCFYESL
jgi:hypothetical protein